MENRNTPEPTEAEVWDIIANPIKSARQQALEAMEKKFAQINARRNVSPEQINKIMNTPYGLR